jgi:hypothetical protein
VKIIRRYPHEPVNHFRSDLIELAGHINQFYQDEILTPSAGNNSPDQRPSKIRIMSSRLQALEEESLRLSSADKLNSDERILLTGCGQILFNLDLALRNLNDIAGIAEKISRIQFLDMENLFNSISLVNHSLFVFLACRELDTYQELQGLIGQIRASVLTHHNSLIYESMGRPAERAGLVYYLEIFNLIIFYIEYLARISDINYYMITRESPELPEKTE